MDIKITKFMPKIYLLVFDTQYHLCMSMLRIQEFYESPKFKGKYFELEEFMEYWCENFGSKGAFDYPCVWRGFNFPGKTLGKWMALCDKIRNPYRKCEEEVMNLICDMVIKNKEKLNDVYIIATYEKNPEIHTTIDHEIAHAFYAFYPEYRKSCSMLLKKADKRKVDSAIEMLLRLGYSKKFLKDEIQAYFSTYNTAKDLMPILDFCRNFEDFKKTIENNRKTV